MDNAAEAAPVEETNTAPSTTEQVATLTDASERPGWLPEKFKSAEDLAKSYTELEKRLGQPKAEVPEKYEVNLPPELLSAVGMEGVEELSSDPMVTEFMGMAKEFGLGNDEVSKVVSWYLNSDAELLKGEEARKQQEMAALGPQANARLREADGWMKANLSEKAYSTLASRLEDASMVEALEELKGLTGEKTLPQLGGLPGESRQEMESKLSAMQFEKDEFGNRRMSTDPKFREQVRQLQIRLHGAGPKVDVVS